MNILFPTWKSFGVEDIKETFEELDIRYHYMKENRKIIALTQDTNQKLKNILKKMI